MPIAWRRMASTITIRVKEVAASSSEGSRVSAVISIRIWMLTDQVLPPSLLSTSDSAGMAGAEMASAGTSSNAASRVMRPAVSSRRMK